MQTKTAKISAKLRWTLVCSLTIPLACHAASFDCAKASNETEKAVCEDPALSALDSQLADAWKLALTDSSEVNVIRSAQRDWLRLRDACGNNRSCLTDHYQQRLNALQSTSTRVGDRWQQSWSLDINSPTTGSTLLFTGTLPKLHFSVDAHAGGNQGSLDGDIDLHGGHAVFHRDQCQLDFTRRGTRIEVTQIGMDSDCDAGMGVYYGGSYIPTAEFSAKPKPDLLNLRVLATAQQNSAAHDLLGTDYQVLVDTVNLWDRDDERDGLGADVVSGFVRGLASTNAFMLMSKSQSLWIGLLVFDASGQVRMRYYSNVPAWKHQIPKTIKAWHDGINEGMPIDLMP